MAKTHVRSQKSFSNNLFRKGIAMKKIIISAMVMALILGLSGLVLAEDNFTKAENFIKIGRLGDAISALEAQIQLKSDDAKAYFMLGNIYLQTNNFAGADREFQAAITFRPAYRAEIGKKFYSAGLTLLNKGEVDWAKDLFQRTLKLDPAQAKNIASACLVASKRYFALSQPEKAEKLLSLVLLDKTLGKQIQAERTKYGEKILAEAKEESSEEKRQMAIKYLGQQKVDAEFPPKQWVVVFSKEYTGKGYGKGDEGAIVTGYAGKQIVPGDKIIVSGKEFEVWEGRWIRQYVKYEVINQYFGSNDTTYEVKAPVGVEFKIRVERFKYPSEKEKLANFSLNQ